MTDSRNDNKRMFLENYLSKNNKELQKQIKTLPKGALDIDKSKYPKDAQRFSSAEAREALGNCSLSSIKVTESERFNWGSQLDNEFGPQFDKKDIRTDYIWLSQEGTSWLPAPDRKEIGSIKKGALDIDKSKYSKDAQRFSSVEAKEILGECSLSSIKVTENERVNWGSQLDNEFGPQFDKKDIRSDYIWLSKSGTCWLPAEKDIDIKTRIEQAKEVINNKKV